MAKKEETKEKGKAGRPAKPAHTLPASFDASKHKQYVELYYDANNQPLPLEAISDRISSADKAIKDKIAQTALDIYFVKMNWSTAYSRDRQLQFKTWLQKTIPFSRGYALDLLKCVKELVEHKGGNSKVLNDAIFASVQGVFENYSISVLREVIHTPDEVKPKLLDAVLNQKEIDVEAIRMQKADFKKAKPTANDQVVQGLKKLIPLTALHSQNPELAEVVDKAIEVAIRRYINRKESTK